MAFMLAGCAGGGNPLGHALVAPGGYEFYDCAQLSREEETQSKKEKDLALLMERAKQSPGGGLVSATAYESDRATALATLEQIHLAQSEKQCTSATIVPAPPTARTRR